jgi:hypothetical protein
MALATARALLAERSISDDVALIGVRGFFASMGATQQNDSGIYDDAIFLVTEEICAGFNANTDPVKYEPPNVTLKAGAWRYRLGVHTPPSGAEPGYPALVQSGLPGDDVWVVVHPRSPSDYRHFATKSGLQFDPGFTEASQFLAALQHTRARIVPREDPDYPDIEWPMREHINIHRGQAGSTSSMGCQTVSPNQWQEFFGAVKSALHDSHQELVTYLLLEGPLPSQ